MIAYDLSQEPTRVRVNFYNLFSPAGRSTLLKLLQEEEVVYNNFVMSYETAELRRLEAQARKRELTEEEMKTLNKAPKVFKGLTKDGGVIEDADAIAVVSEYLDSVDIVEEDLNYLRGFDNIDSSFNSEIILGKPLTYWNLHPDQFPIQVFNSLFVEPVYTRNELIKLFNIKLGLNQLQQAPRIFIKKDEVESLLVNLDVPDIERKALINKLMSIRAIGDMPPLEYKATVVRVIELLIKKDYEFNYDAYLKVKDLLPNYHNQKTKYFIFMLYQFNSSHEVSVSTRLDFNTLHAFYRKAEELCY